MPLFDRRGFLAASSSAALAAGLSSARGSEALAAPLGKAEHCILMWLGGGACQIDTFDPKRQGDPQAKKAGSAYAAIPTAIPGVQVCEHLAKTAAAFDRMIPVRTVHHDVIDEHAAATYRMHTGRPISETIVYPSVGSVIVHERGPAGDGVPAYVLVGYPSTARGPGFLGAKANYVYLTETGSGPAGLTRPADVTADRQSRRENLLAALRTEYRGRSADDARIAAYDDSISEALRLAGPRFGQVFDLDREPAALRTAYGGEFGQRCLLARRLVEAGSRFVEVSHNLNFSNGTGWDTHNEGQLNQHLLIQELDSALAALVLDLEAKRLLDKTLIVVATEFGRPPEFDGGGGRGHQGKAFSVLLAGGGLRTGRAIGTTDDLGKTVADRPVSVPDLHATMYAALGIDTRTDLHAGDRPVPITDGGVPIAELFG